MGGASNVEEVLGISAPELVFFSFFIYSSSSSCVLSPLTFESLLDSIWHLNKLDWVRGKYSQEEWSLSFFFLCWMLGVRDDHVMNWLLVVFREQNNVACDLSLAKSLRSSWSLKHNILLVDFPKSIFFWFYSYYHKIYRDVWSFWNFLILLHKWEDQTCAFRNWDSELWVIKPSVVGVVFDIVLCNFGFKWIWTSWKVANPFSVDRVLSIRWGENLAQVKFVEMSAKVIISHPPITVILENVI